MTWFIVGLIIWIGFGVSFYAGVSAISEKATAVYRDFPHTVGEKGDLWFYMLLGPVLPLYIAFTAWKKQTA